MRRIFTTYLITTLCCVAAVAQSQIDSIAYRAMQVGRVMQQERVYQHFDNTAYYPGETMWFKAYTTFGTNDRPSTLSKVLYVELVAPEGYVVEPLEVVSISPADGETVEKLEQIVVTFNVPVALDETKSINLASVEASDVTPIEAYAGRWKMASKLSEALKYYATGTIEIFDNGGAPALLCKNFANFDPKFGYDDSFIMFYNSEDGSVTLPAQELADFYYEGASHPTALYLTDSRKTEPALYEGKLIGRMENGNIVFENSPENKDIADSFVFYSTTLDGLSLFNELVWTPADRVEEIDLVSANRQSVAGLVSASINPDDATQLIITVNQALANGTYRLTIEAGAIATAEGATNETIICTYILNDPTGIDEVKGEPTVDASQSGEVKAIYDLTGRKVEGPTKGIYIIDGKKVLVK